MKKSIILLFLANSIIFADEFSANINTNFLTHQIKPLEKSVQYDIQYKYINKKIGLNAIIKSYSINPSIEEMDRKLKVHSQIIRDKNVDIQDLTNKILSDKGYYVGFDFKYTLDNDIVNKNTSLSVGYPEFTFSILVNDKGMLKHNIGANLLLKYKKFSNTVEFNYEETDINKTIVDQRFNLNNIIKYDDIVNIGIYSQLKSKEYKVKLRTNIKFNSEKAENNIILDSDIDIRQKSTLEIDYTGNIGYKIGKSFKFKDTFILSLYDTIGLYIQANEKTSGLENINFNMYNTPEMELRYTEGKFSIYAKTGVTYSFDFVGNYLIKKSKDPLLDKIPIPPLFDDVVKELNGMDFNLKVGISLNI